MAAFRHASNAPRASASSKFKWAWALVAGLGCADPSFGDSTAGTAGPEHERLDELLLLTTTDFATGSVASLHLESGSFAEHALGSIDGRIFAIDDHVYVLHRYMYDYLDVFEPAAGWARVAQVSLQREGTVSTNPQSLVKGPDERLYISAYGTPELLIVDLESDPAVVGAVDLNAYADADGFLESAELMATDDAVIVFAQRLDRTTQKWPQVQSNLAIVVDPQTAEVMADYELLGREIKEIRRDPQDTDRVYLLHGDGVSSFDAQSGVSQWVLEPSTFSNAGIDSEDGDLPQAFDLAPDGRFFVAAYDPGFTGVTIYEAEPGADLDPVVSGLLSVDRSLEIVGETMWFADTTPGAEGLRAFDLNGTPLGPRVDTGLPPFSLGARP